MSPVFALFLSLSLCLSVSVYLFLFVRLSLYVSLSLSSSLYLCLYVSLSISFYVSLCVSVSLSVCLALSLPHTHTHTYTHTHTHTQRCTIHYPVRCKTGLAPLCNAWCNNNYYTTLDLCQFCSPMCSVRARVRAPVCVDCHSSMNVFVVSVPSKFDLTIYFRWPIGGKWENDVV